jgi:RNA polymerase sigma-70 factor, ECF subfamily
MAGGKSVSDPVYSAAKGLSGFRRDRPGDTFRGWLRGITRNQILLLLRRNHGKAAAAGGSDALRHLHQVPSPVLPDDDEDDANEISALWRRALDQVRGEFEQRSWHAFWLTVIEGRVPATLTAELGMTVAAIRQAKSRILRRIKMEVGEVVD